MIDLKAYQQIGSWQKNRGKKDPMRGNGLHSVYDWTTGNQFSMSENRYQHSAIAKKMNARATLTPAEKFIEQSRTEHRTIPQNGLSFNCK